MFTPRDFDGKIIYSLKILLKAEFCGVSIKFYYFGEIT